MTVKINGNGQYWAIPGYFAADGNAANSSATSGSVWRAHFNPPAQGTYSYSVSMRQGDKVAVALSDSVGAAVSPNGNSGSFTVSPPNTSASGFNRQGKLEYAYKTYPRLANGQYFVKGGPGSPETYFAMDSDFDATPKGISQMNLSNFSDHFSDWNSGDPTWGGSRGKGIIGSVSYVADVTKSNSIYIVTLTEGGDGNNVFPWPNRLSNDTNNLYTYDVSKLAQWGIVLAHMYDKGVHAHLLLSETETEQFFEHYELNSTGGSRFADARKLYYRELIARFGHLNITWDIGEEFGGGSNGKHGYPAAIGYPGTITQVGLYADYIHAVDPYDSPTVLHTRLGESSVYSSLYGRGSFDGLAVQSYPADVINLTKEFINGANSAGRPWLVSSDEQAAATTANPCYQSMAQLQDEREDVLWGNLMNLGWGVEWYGGYNTCANDFNHRNFRARSTYYEMSGHAINFFMDNLSSKLGSIQKNHGLLSGEAGGGGSVLTVPGSLYVAYLPDASSNATLSVSNGTYTKRWFNPRTGTYGSSESVNGSTISLGTPSGDSKNDWVVLLESGSCTNCSTPIPPTATSVPPTPVPPTATFVPPTPTFVPPTSVPPTSVPPTATPTQVNAPPTATPAGPCGGLYQEAETASIGAGKGGNGAFKIVQDSGANGGKYIEAVEANKLNGNFDPSLNATYCVNIPESGTYAVRARSRAADALHNSLYLYIDNNPYQGYTWHLWATGDYVVTDIYVGEDDDPTLSKLEVQLTAGEHQFSIAGREAGSGVDWFEFVLVGGTDGSGPTPTATPTPTTGTPPTPTANCGGLEQEAEDGQLSGQFTIGSDSAASNGKYVYVPNGFGNRGVQVDAAHKVTYCIQVATSGTYYLNAWTYGASGVDNSFYVRVNGQPSQGILWHTPINTTYLGEAVRTFNPNTGQFDIVELTLEQGEQTVEFFLREDGVRLDRISLVPAAATANQNGFRAMSASADGSFTRLANDIGTTETKKPLQTKNEKGSEVERKLYVPLLLEGSR